MKSTRIIFEGLAALFILAGNVFAFSTHNVTLERTFNKVQERVNEQITVTATLINQESNPLRGVYFAEHIPQGLSVQTVSVKVDGNNVSNYATETGLSGDVYAGCVPHRWILETPSAFSENNPIASGGSVEIVYLLSATQSGAFVLSEFNWVGYYQASADAAFGYSETSDSKTLGFVSPGDLNLDNTVDLTDAILGLQIVVGITPSTQTYVAADVNGDGALGTAELIFILQTIAGLR